MENITQYADMLSAMGTEPRLRVMRLLLMSHPLGMVVSDIQAEIGITGSTLSHHLEKLRHVGLVTVRREGTFLRYLANTDSLQRLLAFLFDECCTRSGAVRPEKILQIRK
jgi:ArsR family transcriptional regulator, arsenate/arsenite/antimonite-responsive transcriptional repressor